jgi:Dolichyl-phosphate-mannose-protein mannosyltransferase
MRVRTVWAVLCIAVGVYLLLVWPSLLGQAVNWRESYVLMVGRDLCRGEGTLWLPRVDTVAEGLGITGMEFPLLNLAAARLACGGPEQVIAARALTLLFALLGIGGVASLASQEFPPEGAILGVVAFAFSPLVLFYGRTIQPDIPALSLALVSLALLELSLPPQRPTRWGLYCLSAGAMALGALVKLPVIVYGLPLAAMLWSRRGREAFADWRYWLYLPLSVVPSAVWYFHARALQQRYGHYDFSLGTGLRELLRTWTSASFYRSIFVQQLFDTYAFPIVSVIAVGSLALCWRQTELWVRALAVSAVVFFFIAGNTAAWHFSYGLLGVPALAFAAAAGAQRLLDRVPGQRSRAVLLGVVLLAVAAYGPWRARQWFAAAAVVPPIETMRKAVDSRLPQGDRVLVVSGGDPKVLWYLDRKGPVVGGNVGPWLTHAGSSPAAVAIDAGAARDWAGVARLALASSGYEPIFQNPAMEVWLHGPLALPEEGHR